MAQTDRYKSFLTQASEKGLINEFDEEDLKLAEQYPEFGTSLLYLKERYKGSTTAEQKALAHEAANQLRQSYAARGSAGTTGTAPGGAYTPSAETKALDTALEKIQSSTYEGWKQGDAYGELKADYEDRGQKAMDDTLAKISARTGGMASSYAGKTAQDSYNEYMRALDEAAYNRYQDDLNRKINLYELMRNAEETKYNRQRAAEETAYSRYLDEISRNNSDRSFAWNQSLAMMDAEQQALENERWERQYADKQTETDRETELDGALIAAYGGDYSRLAKYYGVDENTAQKYFAAQMGGSSSGSGKSGYTGSSVSEDTGSAGIVDTMLGYGNDVQAYEYLVQQGFTNGVTDKLWELYQSEKEKQGQGAVPGSGMTDAQLSPYGKSISQRLATDYSLNSTEKKAELIRNAYVNGLITEEEGYYLMSLY